MRQRWTRLRRSASTLLDVGVRSTILLILTIRHQSSSGGAPVSSWCILPFSCAGLCIPSFFLCFFFMGNFFFCFFFFWRFLSPISRFEWIVICFDLIIGRDWFIPHRSGRNWIIFSECDVLVLEHLFSFSRKV